MKSRLTLVPRYVDTYFHVVDVEHTVERFVLYSDI